MATDKMDYIIFDELGEIHTFIDCEILKEL